MVHLVSVNPRNVSDSGWSVLPPPDSRRQHALFEPVELCTRLAMCGFGPNPAGGFAMLLVHRSPNLDMTDPPHHSGRRFPLARIRTRTLHEIESGYYSWLVTKDYFQKPLSNVASHSRGTTLYGT